MINLKFQEKEKEKIQQHPHYDDNVNWGSKFIERFNQNSKHSFFAMRMVKNTDGVKYFFEFSFVVPKEHAYSIRKNRNAPLEKVFHPAYATALDPNQEKEKFMIGFKNTYCEYFGMQKKWNERSARDEAFQAFDPQ